MLSFEQNILDAELGIENYRFPSGLTLAATQLALHLSGPAESFYCNLSSTVNVQSSYAALIARLSE